MMFILWFVDADLDLVGVAPEVLKFGGYEYRFLGRFFQQGV